MDIFNERLHDLSKKMGKSYKQIADDLELSKSQMSHYTTGFRKVTSELLQKIVDTYKINPQFLFDENASLYRGKINMKSYPYLPTNVAAGLPENICGITNSDIEHMFILVK